MTLPSKKRIALIGLGKIAQKAYLPFVVHHPEIQAVFCTRNQDTLVALAQRYRVSETYASIDRLIAGQPDAAMVHSTTASHFELVRKLLEANIPVFVDKPLSDRIEECDALLQLAAQKQLPLYVGFNRRFAPLIRQLKDQAPARHILWMKNRVKLAENPRTFIFDDFIHVLDSLRFLAEGPISDLQVKAHMQEGLLEDLHVQWQQGDTLLCGTMNRLSGRTEERVEYFAPGHKWEIQELHSGTHYFEGKQEALGFGNWTSTLHKRGFHAMFEDWLDRLDTSEPLAESLEDIRTTHQLCETILSRITPLEG
ncbi:MAG: Gfo/Idh/MocA family oxidoreductase [Bacteroidota bacterium]